MTDPPMTGLRGVEVDVLIVGARIAGSVLAVKLGDAGIRVLLVDRATFPSSTLSTHFFRGSGLAGVLAEMGLLDAVLALGSPRLICEHDHDVLTETSDVAPPEAPGDLGFNLSVRREPLDAMLVEIASGTASVTFLDRTSLDMLRRKDDRIVGALLSGPDGALEVGARIVVGADGHASRVASQVESADQERAAATRVMYYRYVRGMRGPRGDPDGAEFSLADDELLYAFPSDDDLTCVAVSLPLSTYAGTRTDPDRSFQRHVSGHPAMAIRYTAAQQVGRLFGCGPRPSVVRAPWGPGWALVGDASLHQDPWTGHGMDNASVHASFLAESLVAWLSGREHEQDALGRYHERRDAHALEGFRETVEIGRNLNVMRD